MNTKRNDQAQQQNSPRQPSTLQAPSDLQPPQEKQTLNVTLSEMQRQILELLYSFKFLEVTTLHQQLAPQQSRQAMQAKVSQLEAAGLVKGHRHPPGPTLYGLTKLGGAAIGKILTSQHYRRPSTRTQDAKKAQLVIESEAQRRGLVLYQATPASPFNQNREASTRQVLIAHYGINEGIAIQHLEAATGELQERRRRDLQAGLHPVPATFREYYMHYPERTGLVVIPSGPHTDERYWLRRKEQLSELALTLPVLGVFHREPPPQLLTMLKQGHFKACTLDKFGAALDKLLPLARSRN